VVDHGRILRSPAFLYFNPKRRATNHERQTLRRTVRSEWPLDKAFKSERRATNHERREGAIKLSQDEFLKDLPLVNSPELPASFQVRGVAIGGGRPVIIAGPCAVETAEQIMATARFLKANGASGLRGGVFKPRSSPYSFQGLGREGLEHLARAREETGLFTVIEVTALAQIETAFDYADVFQIGARNMQNFELLKAVGHSYKPVLLKRGLSATVQELLQAAEYILNEGNLQVILCERGIRTFETSTRNTLDINAIPLLKQLTKLPVFADPSHGTGRSDLVIPVAKAALSAGADGLLIEVHPDPDKALSDGGQSLDFSMFKQLMAAAPGGRAASNSERKSCLTIWPEKERFERLAATGAYDYIPVYSEVVADTETPVTAFVKLTQGTQRFLLESVDRGEQVGRYSFIGWDPLVQLQAFGTQVTVRTAAGERVVNVADPLRQVQVELDRLKVALLPELGQFYGGAVGFLGYDYVRTIELLPEKNGTEIGAPDFQWMIPRYLARFDHVTHKITLIVLSHLDEATPDQAYAVAHQELQHLTAQLDQFLELPPLNRAAFRQTPAARRCSLSREEYMAGVRRIKEYINAGDAFQVVLSQRIEEPFTSEPFLFYRLLRTINPSPYLFFLDFGALQVAGSSPEVMTRLEGDRVLLKPIAGTKPRGGTPEQDAALSDELLNDEKERAEHVMLVDLGRNDLGRVCEFGSVRVAELMTVEYYSHVMHIVSAITGKLRPGYTGVELLRAVFPAGTLSGAPKVRAMEIIEELEPIRRELYGGAVGYLGFNGNLDTCITIRTVFFKDRKAYLQSGAGIVAGSVPECEYEETMNKAGALLAALERVGD
jgi:anthranilate synthase component 1